MPDDPRPDDLGARLLDAHVIYERRQLLDGVAYSDLVASEIDAVLSDAANLTLAECVSPKMIKDTAYKYAVQMPLGGLIPEIVGEVAARLYSHQVHDRVHVEDVLDAQDFDTLVEAIAQMDATDRILRGILGSPVMTDICVDILVASVESGLRDVGRDQVSGRRSRAVSRLSSVVRPVVPTVEATAEWIVRPAARFILDAIADDGTAQILDTARDVWRRHADESVGGFRELVTGDDVEDLIIVVIEFWRTFRETDYFRELLYEAIDHIFDQLGDTSLVDLLENLGIGRGDLVEEAHRFGPPVIAELDRRGMLEPALRRHLAPFYASQLFHDAVAAPMDTTIEDAARA